MLYLNIFLNGYLALSDLLQIAIYIILCLMSWCATPWHTTTFIYLSCFHLHLANLGLCWHSLRLSLVVCRLCNVRHRISIVVDDHSVSFDPSSSVETGDVGSGASELLVAFPRVNLSGRLRHLVATSFPELVFDRLVLFELLGRDTSVEFSKCQSKLFGRHTCNSI